nr:MAG TPA: hypothetical protein [Caudoviricetes sp.]
MRISNYTSDKPLMGISENGTKGTFARFNYDINGNGDSDGLCYNPKKNKDVPYTFTRYVGVKVINGYAFQLEEAPKNLEKFNRGIEWYRNGKKVGTSEQDLCITKLPYTVNSIAFTNHSGYRDTNITVKYSGDITWSDDIDKFKIRYYDGNLGFFELFNDSWILTSEIVGYYDGVGNYNDWLFTVLLDFDIYPLKIGDKPFDYFDLYGNVDGLGYYLQFYANDTMMTLFKKLYDNPLYAKVKEELKKQYPNEEYFELYNVKENTVVSKALKSCTYKWEINGLTFSGQECKIYHYIFQHSPKKEVIDSFITYINKIAKRTDELTYKEVMTERQTIADFGKKHKVCVSSYLSCSGSGDNETCDWYHGRINNSKLICYKRCKQEKDDTQYLLNGLKDWKEGYDIWKEHNPNTDKSEYEKHKDDEFYINDMINDFVYGLSSGENGDNHPEADTYYFDMAWITHGIPLK